MKKIEYLQFEYRGEYQDKVLNVPDGCTMYKIYSQVSYQYNDDLWTSSYLIISPIEVEGFDLVGNIYIFTMDCIIIKNSEIPILGIEEAPKFKREYAIQYCFPERREIMDILGKDLTEESFEELKKLYYQIESISLLRNFTPIGLSVTKLTLRDYYDGSIRNRLAIEDIKYDSLYKLKCTSDPEIHKIFLEGAEKVYKYFINETTLNISINN